MGRRVRGRGRPAWGGGEREREACMGGRVRGRGRPAWGGGERE